MSAEPKQAREIKVLCSACGYPNFLATPPEPAQPATRELPPIKELRGIFKKEDTQPAPGEWTVMCNPPLTGFAILRDGNGETLLYEEGKFDAYKEVADQHNLELRQAREDSERLARLSELLIKCPHTEITYNDDPNTEHGVNGLMGFLIRIEGCETLEVCAPTLRELLDKSRAALSAPTAGEK